MHASALTVFVFFANGTALTMALAMLFLVLWQAPRETDNRLMAALFLAMAIWSGSIFTARLLHAVGGDPRRYFYGTVLGSALTTFALFVLVTHYVGFWERTWARVLLAIGLLATVVLGPLLYSDRLVDFIGYTAEGLLEYRMTPLAFAVLGVYAVFDAVALGVLWIHRRERAGRLLVGAACIAAATLLTALIPAVRIYPLPAVACAVSSVLFAQAILTEKLFNPLAQKNLLLEREIAQREELIAELNAFAHTVAHDLKNPLAPILVYSEALRDRDDLLPAHERRELLGAIARSAEQMRRIIDALLLLGGVRQQQVDLIRLDMGTIVADAVADNRYLIDERGARITVAAAWPPVAGYAPWVEAVWSNYISNAIKYGGDPPRVEIGVTPGRDHHTFWVRDNGRGLSPEQQARLFTPFTRLHHDAAEGHGLGLSIVQRIVERLGGTVAVASDGLPDHGSTFSFTLPAPKT